MRRGPGRILALLAALATVAALFPAAASASDAARLYPVNLRLDGNEGPWSSYNYFRLRWERPSVSHEGFPITGADYSVRDAAGNVVVSERHISGDVVSTEPFGVPWSSPGAYTADLWLEGPGGERGPQASTMLGYDDARPGLAQPLFPAVWASASQAAVVRISHPSGPLPVSGIRGYAISVDRGAGSLPCAGRERCTLAETDLDGGIGDDEIALKDLGEGTHYVRALAVSRAGMRSAETETAIVRVDPVRPETTLAGAPAGWASGPVRLTATATDSMSGMAADGPGGPFTAIAIDGGVPRTDLGPTTTATVTGEGVHNVAYYARDAAGNFGDVDPRTAAVRIDEGPPTVAFARSQDPAEPERIEAAVADPLSGPGGVRGSIAVRPQGTRQRFEPLPTAVSAGRLVAHWDSDSFPHGSYEFRVTGYDAAGNAASSDRRGTGARMVLGNPLKTPTTIEAGFGGRRLVWQRCAHGKSGRRHCRRTVTKSFESRPRARTVPYGRGVSFGGRLASSSRSAVGGLAVQIVETFDPGAESSQRTTTVRTGADGTFQARLAPGPSRRVEAVFPGTRTLTRAADGPVRLGVLTGVRLRASSGSARIGGAPVAFHGSVGGLGAPIPADGRPVQLQFRLPGGDWSEFRTVQTDRHGHFRYPYAFTDDDSAGVRFQFRAYAPQGGDWPYEPAASLPVAVTGR